MGGFQGHEHANVAVFSGDLSPSPFPSMSLWKVFFLGQHILVEVPNQPNNTYLTTLFITHRYADIVIR